MRHKYKYTVEFKTVDGGLISKNSNGDHLKVEIIVEAKDEPEARNFVTIIIAPVMLNGMTFEIIELVKMKKYTFKD